NSRAPRSTPLPGGSVTMKRTLRCGQGSAADAVAIAASVEMASAMPMRMRVTGADSIVSTLSVLVCYGLRCPCSRWASRQSRWGEVGRRGSPLPVGHGLRRAMARSALDEEEIFATWQRAVGEGLLASCSRLHHIIANQAKQLVDLDA